MLSARYLKLPLTAMSHPGCFRILSGVDFLGDRLRDLVRGEFLRIGEIGTVGFKIDFTNGVTADYIRTSVRTSVTRVAKGILQPVADFQNLP